MNPNPWLTRTLVLVVCACLLGGCMLARQGGSISIIAPEIQLETRESWPEGDWTLQIQRPHADRMRDGGRIMVREAGSRLKPYPELLWMDSIPDMFQSLLIQAFEDANRLSGVDRPGGTRARYALSMEIRRFEAVDTGGPDLRVELAVQASLVHVRSSRQLASRTFRQETDARGKAQDPLVAAFETALGAMLTEMVGWVLEEGEAAEAAGREWRRDNERRDRANSPARPGAKEPTPNGRGR